ncbi:hypothetical protein CYY_002968 [Polysphondylium violaceum]|uniref:BP74 N-terminal domain-containing protein n=1 Tax=Polysphondylium violaceum TaxID=133409 RepID=A0A8J4PYF5_9MYCE|nr:hypothetical protein CYY_002968 [Polysphondylium violaceum]
MNKLLIGTLIVFVTLLAVASCDEAYFGFKTHANEHEFVFKLTDVKKIEHARKILSGDEKNEVHVLGRFKKTKKDYNPHYNFHLEPENTSFFEMAIEVCDASLEYTEEHLDEACGAFLPGCMYCPWSSKLTREVKV